jgi:hypothetical protein
MYHAAGEPAPACRLAARTAKLKSNDHSSRRFRMYQRYPDSAKAVQPDRGPAPQPIQNAVKLMYAGAALSTISFIVSFATVGDLKANIRKAYPKWTAHQVSQAATSTIIYAVIAGLLGIGLWVWMARKNGQGRMWARMVASVLFAFNTLSGLAIFKQHSTAPYAALWGLTWLAGLGAVILLWQRPSTDYYNQMRDVA